MINKYITLREHFIKSTQTVSGFTCIAATPAATAHSFIHRNRTCGLLIINCEDASISAPDTYGSSKEGWPATSSGDARPGRCSSTMDYFS